MQANKSSLRVAFASTESTPRMIKFAKVMGKLCCFHLYFYSRPIGRPYFWSKYRLNNNCSIEKGNILINGKSFNPNILKKVINFKPDVLILGGFFELTHFLLYVWGVLQGLKIVVFSEPFWNYEIGSKKKLWHKKIIAQFFIKVLYHKVDMIWAVGFSTKQFFTKYVCVEEKKVQSITYPVDIESHLLHPLRKNKKDLVFLFPHRLIEWYNPLQCLKWFIEIQKDFKHVRLIFNAHGHLRGELEKNIALHHITTKVSFADSISNWDDMAKIYSDSDILLSTKSIAENGDWSVAEIESLASGMGVIAIKNSRGLNDAIISNNSGFIIENFEDINTVKNAVSKYIHESDLLERHGKINKKIAIQYSTEVMARKYYDLLKTL